MYNFFMYSTMTIFIIVCVFLILLVLIQKGRGGGLASAFGGGGGNTAFGSKTGDVLTWATSIVFGVFLLLAIGLNLMANRSGTPATAAQSSPPPAAPAPAPSVPSTAPSNVDMSLPLGDELTRIPPAPATAATAPVTTQP
jgi:preprotein translocase subunit SecG